MEKPVKPMGKRRLGRELAVQFLYQYDLTQSTELAEALELFWQTQPATKESARQFAEELVRGCLEHREQIDAKLQQYAEHWNLPRMAAVDRNVLRLAIYEMIYRTDIPPVVSINEAVDIAKKYSTRESGAFVNGILDKLRLDLPRPARTAQDKR